ncbi:TonB-dependent receptor plug domain-containing protein [Pelosinus sp. sgz500959]|uniref:TonB-dependent receptor plug domain-containing protein n=1 Tax=Pelosinus sp. sgz500959 TaxID=3242472 RepID=UPI00366E32D9
MNLKQKKLLCSLIGGTLLFSMSGVGSAAEAPEENFNFDEYVVTASRMPVKMSEVAANVTVVTHDEIEKGNFINVPDILRKANVTVEDGSSGSIPFLNGDNRVLVLVDGRRMNWDQIVTSASKGGVNLNNIAVNNIERIEIVRGPSSSLYGSDAVGGVINIITRKATKESTSIATEAGSWGMRRYNFTTENKLENGFGYMITAEHKKQDNIEYKNARTGQVTTLPQSYLEQDSMTMRLDKDLSNGRSLSLQVEHTDKDFGFGGTAPGQAAWHYENGSGNSKDDNMALTYNLGADNFFRVYRNHSTEKVSYDGLTTGYDVERNATGAEWQQSKQLNAHHTLVTGADWRQTDFKYVSQVIDNTYTTKAFFLEDHWQLPSNWTLTLGSRYDNHSIIGDHITSRLTANRKMNDKTNVFASWGQFVKSPQVEDLFSNTQWFMGNPNLRPETGETVTIGINTEIKDGTKVQASVFSSRVKDAIDYMYPANSRGFAYNIANQKRQGFDLNLSHQFSSQWSASAGYSYVQIKNMGAGATDYSLDLSNSQPNGYHLGVQYDQDKWNAGLTLRAASGRSLQQFTSSSYITLDMVANYKINSDTRIYLKGYNLTNRAYELKSLSTFNAYLTPGAYPMAARSFYMGVEHRM